MSVDETYAALQRAPIDIISAELANSHGGIFMGVHLDECKATVGLESCLNNEPEILEQGNEIILGGIRCEVSDVAGCLPLGSLLNNHVIALHTVCWEMVVTERSSWSHSHSCHSLLLRDRGLSLLVGPVATNCARTEPLAIHGVQSLFSIWTLTERNETIATRATSFHIPHDTSFGYGAKSGECLEQDFIIDLIAQIAHENMEVVGSVLLVRVVRLVCPVHTDFLVTIRILLLFSGCGSEFTYRLMNASSVEGLHSSLSRTRIIVFNETIIQPLALEQQ